MNIRAVQKEDWPAVGRIAEAAGLFPAEALPAIAAGGPDDEAAVWRLSTDDKAGVVGFAFAREEPLTDRVWNVMALAVDPAWHRKGHGRALLGDVERDLNARMILIETTQLPDQAPARELYTAMGYGQEGRVRDYYAEGEDKVIFRKVVS